MYENEVIFSIARHAAWSPSVTTQEGWAAWSQAPRLLTQGEEPKVAAMPPMLRRRAGLLGRMALEVAYGCIGQDRDVPTVFCSRHGEVVRSVELLRDLARGEPLSPTAFGLAVHNAIAGLFSIARTDRANHVALAAGAATFEHAVIEACGQLADGAPMVLIVACDMALPDPFAAFQDCDEQPFAFAWAIVPAQAGVPSLRLAWQATDSCDATIPRMPGGLDVLRFQLSNDRLLVRDVAGKRWSWGRNEQ